MKVHKKIERLNIKNAVVTIGMFDGVHRGHKEIIQTLKKAAQKVNGETVLLSFWPHPRMIFEGDENIRLLSTMEEKVKLLEEAGIDHLVIIPFNRDFANITYKKFVRNYLVDMLNSKVVIIGYDHQFGKNREGNFDKLTELGKQYGFSVQKLDAQMVANENVSSSVARKALAKGDIELANDYLGYNYSFTGFVVEGKKNGRKIGYPTANIYMREPYKLIPGIGVYAVRVIIDEKLVPGMMNVGYRPTIIEDNKQKSIEVHIFDMKGDYYGKELTVYVKKKIREEEKFSSVDALVEQLKEDESVIRQYLDS